MPGNLTIYVDIDPAEMKKLAATVKQQLDAGCLKALREAAEYTQDLWVKSVSGQAVPGVNNPLDDPFYASLVGNPKALKIDEKDLVAEIDPADHEYIIRREEGFPSYDMKPGLLSRTTAKTGKRGQRYVRVAMHNKPDQTPDVRRTKTIQVMSAPYMRGGKPVQESYTWKHKPTAKMFLSADGVETTIRTVSEQWTDKKGKTHGSDPFSWIHPGRSASRIVAAIREAGRAKLESLIKEFLG